MAKKNTNPQKKKNNAFKALLINRVATGDFITLSKILGCTQDAARMRFHRSDPKALRKMQVIIESREKLIAENQD